MKYSILHCTNCRIYTLKTSCPLCNNPAITTKPAKYSPEDRLGIWRRKAKLAQNKNV